ncbi:MAG TPA: hypothetical protein VFO23_07885 [Steroidobacteraceae bacterium]|nr:hypothetical protein [Steroidobacteraceae bacterium]
MPRPGWTIPASKAAINVAFLAVIGVAAGATVLYGVVSAKSSTPPAPTITAQPPSHTASTSATFGFTDSLSGVTFKCSLDGATATTCTSTKTYFGLAAGSHTFAVTAQNTGGTSSATTASWLVDLTPPAVSVSFPAGGGSYSAAGWSSGCTTPGVCGTASDPSGVASVQFSVLQASSGKYWNGSSFASSSEVFNNASGTATWGYALARPTDGSYTLHVRATDGVGNTTPSGTPASVTFGVDIVAPPAPSIASGPDNLTNATTATFSFADSESGVSFQCSLDGGAYTACSSPTSYGKLAASDHVFAVRALDAAGNASGSTSYPWTILVKQDFVITGSVAQPLYPGAVKPMNLTFTNPFNFAIRVTAVTIAVAHQTTVNGNPNPGCDGPANIVVAQDFGTPVVIPANATASLLSLHVSSSLWPQIEMLDLSTNQDACKGATYSFSFSGTAAKANQ